MEETSAKLNQLLQESPPPPGIDIDHITSDGTADLNDNVITNTDPIPISVPGLTQSLVGDNI